MASYDVTLHGEELVWYREEQLRTHHDISVTIANLTNETQVESILRLHPSEVIYLPPGVDSKSIGDMADDTGMNAIMAQSLSELGSLLESLRKLAPCTRVVLMSRSKYWHGAYTSTTFLAWMETFELLLSTYHNIYHIPIGIFRLTGVHGPWGREALHIHDLYSRRPPNLSELTASHCWYVKDVIVKLLKFAQDSSECTIMELEPCTGNTQIAENSFKHNEVTKVNTRGRLIDLETSIKWAESYVTGHMPKTSDFNVIFTSYFTSTADSQRSRHQAPNRFQYMADFYWSLKKQGLRAVVFHDSLDASFQHRVTSDYPRLTFTAVTSLHNRSTNDARFYAYYKYLREHPEITRVLLTDISDVTFQNDPFELMSLLGDWLYVGTDIDIFPNMKTMPWIKERLWGCFGNKTIDDSELEMDTVYNAGTIGGSRHTVLDALTMIVTYLDSSPVNLNCNMPSVNHAVHKHFFQRVFTGFPLNSRFLRYQSAPKGVYLVHK